MKHAFFVFFLCISAIKLLHGQVADNFSDTNLVDNPIWSGDLDKFKVANGELQLFDENAGSSNEAVLFLTAPTSIVAPTSWVFKIRQEFSPSASNFSRIYLAADDSQLANAQMAYYIQIGGISGSEDAVELYRVDAGGERTILISGAAGAVAAAHTIQVRVNRSVDGLWTLEVDYQGGDNYQLEGSQTDITYDLLNYFGIYCRYSSTRSDKIFFDNILIDPIISDETAPLFQSLEIISKDSLRVVFNEALDLESATRVFNYTIDNGIGTPQTASLGGENANEVLLRLQNPLRNLETYQLSIAGVRDIAGNSLSTTVLVPFEFLETVSPDPGDLMITELMINPNGVAGLPRAEYIELYNRSNKVLDLTGVGIASGGSPKLLTTAQLRPGAYLLLVNANDADEFSSFGNIEAVPSLPTLSNNGDEVELISSAGRNMQFLQYNTSWYEDSEARNGGYALERLSLAQPENCPGNWRASQDPRGGTPGALNSIDGLPPEMDPPFVKLAFLQGRQQLKVAFNEPLSALMESPDIYVISPAIDVLNARLSGPSEDTVTLDLEEPIEDGVLYTLSIQQVEDCLINFSDTVQTVSFAIPETYGPGEVLINEVLFDAQSGGRDFVEVVNVSDKVISLKGMLIRNTFKISGSIETEVAADILLLPNQIMALTDDPLDVQNRYLPPSEANITETDLPTLEASEGNVSLLLNNQVIDAFDYSDDLHNPLLETEKGVSLERLSLMVATQSTDNWTSAAQSVGFATPGYTNSQNIGVLNPGQEVFSLEQETFSPDSDGNEDLLILNYQTDQVGYLANVRVYDAMGRLVKNLARNNGLASEGLIIWDGTNEEGAKARIGIYVIWVELFTPDGDKTIEKIPCVLAGRL